MGVKGLTSTILSKKSLVKFNETFNLTKLSKTQEILLVVDAYALLYFSITNSGMDWINGGEYEVFAKYFHEYLTIFQTSSIKLIMVFDGLYENHKLDTLISRQVDNIKNNESICNTFPDSFVTSKKIRNPFGLETVAIDVMNKFENITVVISPMEADPFMAKLAQEHEAFGVVTNDSDFMIYDTNGMIPCETIQITEKKEILVSKKTPKSIAQQLQIPCESDSHKTLLPLLACLLGNDYIPQEDLKPVHEYLFQKYRKSSEKSNSVPNVVAFLREFHYADNSKKKKKEKKLSATTIMFKTLFTEALNQKKKKRKDNSIVEDDATEVEERIEYLVALCERAMSVYDINDDQHESRQYSNLFTTRPKTSLKRPKRKPKKITEIKDKSAVEVESFEEEPKETQEGVEEGNTTATEGTETVVVEKKQEEEPLIEEKKEEGEEEEEDEKKEENILEEEEKVEEVIVLKGESTFLLKKFETKEKIVELFKNGKLPRTLFDTLYERKVFLATPIESTPTHEFWKNLRKRIYLFYFYSTNDFKEDDLIPMVEYYSFEKSYKKHELNLTLEMFKSEFPETLSFENEKKLMLEVLKYTPSEGLKLSEDYYPLIAVLVQWLSLRKGTIKLWEVDCLLACLSFKDFSGVDDYATFKEKSGEKRNKFVSANLIDISSQFHVGVKLALMVNDSLGKPFKSFEHVHYLFSSLRFQNYYSKAQTAFATNPYSIAKLISVLNLTEDVKLRMATLRNEILKNLK